MENATVILYKNDFFYSFDMSSKYIVLIRNEKKKKIKRHL